MYMYAYPHMLVIIKSNIHYFVDIWHSQGKILYEYLLTLSRGSHLPLLQSPFKK